MATLIQMVELAERNNWNFSMDIEDNRPYFMKDGKYAAPDETTTKEDKELLAGIISEGSDELKKAILICWENNLKIAGPCSGIKEEHKNQPHSVHFGVMGPEDMIMPLCENLKAKLPDYDHMYRENTNNTARYDFDYFLKGKNLSKEESNTIFKVIVSSLEDTLGIHDDKKALS